MGSRIEWRHRSPQRRRGRRSMRSDCRTRMAQVVYEDPIHHLSGKISKKYRTCYNYRKRSDRKYTSVHGDRTTPLTQAEIDWRTTFAQICQATMVRLADPTTMAQDQMDFRSQTKYKTLYQYVWNLMRDEIEGK